MGMCVCFEFHSETTKKSYMDGRLFRGDISGSEGFHYMDKTSLGK